MNQKLLFGQVKGGYNFIRLKKITNILLNTILNIEARTLKESTDFFSLIQEPINVLV